MLGYSFLMVSQWCSLIWFNSQRNRKFSPQNSLFLCVSCVWVVCVCVCVSVCVCDEPLHPTKKKEKKSEAGLDINTTTHNIPKPDRKKKRSIPEFVHKPHCMFHKHIKQITVRHNLFNGRMCIRPFLCVLWSYVAIADFISNDNNWKISAKQQIICTNDYW